MNEKGNKLGYFLAFFLIAAIGFSVYWLFLKPDGKENENLIGDNNQVQENNNQNEQENVKPQTEVDDTQEEEQIPDQEEPIASDTDFSSYSASNQSIGSSTNKAEYVLKSITDSKMDGYHSFDFLIQAKTSDTTESPYIVVKYLASSGAIRVDLNGVTKDESGIGYQKSRNINEQGVIRLYHNISSDSTEELYDIGLSKSTVFKVLSEEVSDNTWKITVNVKYPGTTQTTSESFGSDTFSKDLQAIDGAQAVDNAKVLSYSYSAVSGVFTIAFNVSGSETRPVPSATAQYNSDGILELVFNSVVSDSVYNSLDGKKLSGLTFDTSKSGQTTKYLINGASKEFKLYGVKSPNQVVLEVKL